jgi:Cysteine-rich CPXCG
VEPATLATVSAPAIVIESTLITCPYCWESIEIELDLSVDGQRYVEDCSVCCRPIVIVYRVEDGALASLETEPESGA